LHRSPLIGNKIASLGVGEALLEFGISLLLFDRTRRQGFYSLAFDKYSQIETASRQIINFRLSIQQT
jgi:hypothetical protein